MNISAHPDNASLKALRNFMLDLKDKAENHEPHNGAGNELDLVNQNQVQSQDPRHKKDGDQDSYKLEECEKRETKHDTLQCFVPA